MCKYMCNVCGDVYDTRSEAERCCPDVVEVYELNGSWVSWDEATDEAELTMGCNCQACVLHVLGMD
jgi:hypothetical protein